MDKKLFMGYGGLQMFAEDDITMAADLEPAISVDFANRLHGNITELQELLGVTEMLPMNAGTVVKIYKLSQVNTPAQVNEGETIGLTKIKRELAKTIELTLKKYRKQTTAEAIQKTGRDTAINKTDEKLISGIQKEIKQDFYTLLKTGTGKASGTNLQTTLANSWAAVAKFYEDEDATPIYFVAVDDLADYLGSASITLQTAFGLTYIENFLGLGTVVVSPALDAGTVIATAKENLNGAYVPASSGDVAQSFGLTADATGLVGMTHATVTTNASIETLVFTGVEFFPELLDGVIVATIGTTETSTEA